ncbi:putative hydrolases of HD superfamily [Loktanella fryxellensis]|uniref:Putative hydrolases of HD superfamily n=1 Tax=Loktanella fryxellensis TaxID=245187 RepID=A0A1H8F6E4_9RHOB|nr:HD domain-containing protein [Loktanella fryxellensis]SEN27383.1 putative hydrolases of HD superfamily [Loktanella fryxellensis]
MTGVAGDRLSHQLAFLRAADGLKSVTRANALMDGTRRENTAEHSWHLALWALVWGAPDPAIPMALLHDLIEVHAGDHPIHLPQDYAAIAMLERAAADRLYPLLPDDQGQAFRALWESFEAATTPVARTVRTLDSAQPLMQELGNVAQTDVDRDIARALLTTGRTASLANDWPALYAYSIGLLDRTCPTLDPDTAARLRFLAEADRLKTVLRATTLFDGSRRENSAEHSWHLALYALTLAEHAARPVDTARVIAMLLIHDLVEIDAGDVPVHAAGRDHAAHALIEARAAHRIFGLLPAAQGAALLALWQEFEAATSDDAIFAKALDRVQPVMANLATGGGTWPAYRVTRAQLQTRVGAQVLRGAPAVWQALEPAIDAWFAASAQS